MNKRISKLIILIMAFTFVFNFNYTYTFAADKELVTLTKEGQAVDSLNGVDAIYRPGSTDGSSATYSCAAYIKKYYKTMYGVTPMNLFYNRTPVVSGDKFIKVSSPRIGDIVAINTSRSTTHWAIVKEVKSDVVVLIEQNWKWKQGGKYVAQINREISISSATYFRLESENNKKVQEVKEVVTKEEVIKEQEVKDMETSDIISKEDVIREETVKKETIEK